MDTTAAGDVFSGALAAHISGGNDIYTSLRFASHAAAVSTTVKGATDIYSIDRTVAEQRLTVVDRILILRCGGGNMARYLLAHDLGTTGNKATLFTEEGELIRSIVYAYDTH